MKLPQIYVSCLPSDDSKLDKWIDSNQSLTEIMGEIQSVIEECLYKNPLIAEFIDEHGELGKILLSKYGYNTAKIIMDKTYEGQYCSAYEFAEAMVVRVLPKEWRMFFNMDKFMDELFRNEYFKIEIKDAVHIFKKYDYYG